MYTKQELEAAQERRARIATINAEIEALHQAYDVATSGRRGAITKQIDALTQESTALREGLPPAPLAPTAAFLKLRRPYLDFDFEKWGEDKADLLTDIAENGLANFVKWSIETALFQEFMAENFIGWLGTKEHTETAAEFFEYAEWLESILRSLENAIGEGLRGKGHRSSRYTAEVIGLRVHDFLHGRGASLRKRRIAECYEQVKVWAILNDQPLDGKPAQ